MGWSAANDVMNVLAGIEPVVVEGPYYRHGNPRYRLDEVPPKAAASSRWQREGDPAALHLSDSEQATWAEWAKVSNDAVDRTYVRRRFGRIDVSVHAVDLRDPDVQKALDIEGADLTSDDYSTCRRIADAARTLGIEALLAPSAAREGATTLVVLPAGLRRVRVICEQVLAPP